MSGHVLIHRSLFGHPAFRNESETMAFAWMIGKAAWRDTRVRYKGHAIGLKRGQLAISQRDMASAFGRDKAWIERLWKRLKSEAMVETSVEAGVAVITICNYDRFQGPAAEREAAREAQAEAGNEAAARQRRGTEQRREEAKKEERGLSRTRTREPALPNDLRAVMEEAGLTTPQNPALLKTWYDLAESMFDQSAEVTLEQDILPTIRRETEKLKAKGQPPRFLKVFDAAIREKFADDEREIARLRKISARYAPQEART